MTATHPFSTNNQRIPYVDAIAQCTKCKGTSSYDTQDAYLRRELRCHSCGGLLKLYAEVRLGATR